MNRLLINGLRVLEFGIVGYFIMLMILLGGFLFFSFIFWDWDIIADFFLFNIRASIFGMIVGLIIGVQEKDRW